LDEFGGKWELNPGDGAFYGPKVWLIIRVKYVMCPSHGHISKTNLDRHIVTMEH